VRVLNECLSLLLLWFAEIYISAERLRRLQDSGRSGPEIRCVSRKRITAATGKQEAGSPPPDSGLIGFLELKKIWAEQESY
jgi:hypothetical protein